MFSAGCVDVYTCIRALLSIIIIGGIALIDIRSSYCNNLVVLYVDRSHDVYTLFCLAQLSRARV